MKLSTATFLIALPSLLLASPASADITWTGAVSSDIFDEANWDLTQSTVTVIDPNVTIADNVIIRNATGVIEIPEIGGGGQFRFQVDEGRTMVVENSRLVSLGNDGIGSVPGTAVGMALNVQNGASCEPFFVVNEVRVKIDATSTVIFGGSGNPVNLSYVDMTFGATMRFLLEDPTAFTNEHLSKVTVDGVPAVLGVNLDVVSDGNLGSIVTVIQQTLGMNYCMANPNSTGAPAAMSATGSASVAANDVTLECSVMPQNSFAFFLTSTMQGFVMNPGGSEGNLCLGGAIGRYVGPGEIQQSGVAGTVSLTIDLTMVPSPIGFVSVMPGETRSFQCWFRDSNFLGQAVSNFSDGLEITFL